MTVDGELQRFADFRKVVMLGDRSTLRTFSKGGCISGEVCGVTRLT
jgi:hypothetical protein